MRLQLKTIYLWLKLTMLQVHSVCKIQTNFKVYKHSCFCMAWVSVFKKSGSHLPGRAYWPACKISSGLTTRVRTFPYKFFLTDSKASEPRESDFIQHCCCVLWVSVCSKSIVYFCFCLVCWINRHCVNSLLEWSSLLLP